MPILSPFPLYRPSLGTLAHCDTLHTVIFKLTTIKMNNIERLSTQHLTVNTCDHICWLTYLSRLMPFLVCLLYTTPQLPLVHLNLCGWCISYAWHVVTAISGNREVARRPQFLKTLPCGGFFTPSISQAATWHSSCNRVSRSRTSLSTTCKYDHMSWDIRLQYKGHRATYIQIKLNYILVTRFTFTDNSTDADRTVRRPVCKS